MVLLRRSGYFDGNWDFTEFMFLAVSTLDKVAFGSFVHFSSRTTLISI